MNDRKHLAIFLRQGFYQGMKGGFFSSVIFLILLYLLFCIVTFNRGYFTFKELLTLLYLIPTMLLFAIPLGFFPAVFIGMFLGLILASVFYKFQSRIENNKWSVVVTVLISLLVALPAISAWWLLIIYRNNFEGLGNFPTILVIIFMPFCIGAGIYIHAKLEAFLVEFGDLFNE